MNRPDYPWERRRRRRVSFRGVPFEILEQERGGGKRATTHTYPYIDTPFTDDLGRNARVWRVQAIISGENYDRDVARLVNAFDKRGRGRLELWFGDPLSVVARDHRVIEKSDAQGFARISVEFVEAGRRIQPERRAGRSLIDRALGQVKAAATAAFPAVASNVSTVGSLGQRMFDLGAQLQGELAEKLDIIDRNAGGASEAASNLADFSGRLASLATDAGGLATSVLGLVDDLVAIPGEIAGKFAAIADLVGWGDTLDPVDVSTLNGQLEAANQDALADLVSRLAAGQLASLTTQMTFESAQDASEHRERLSALLDGVLLRAADGGNGTVFSELRAAKATAIQDLDARAARLPVRVEMSLRADTPSIVLAYRLYEDAARGPSIADRNRVRHPAFMPAVTPLEVISEVPGGAA